jgi:hypothetical protein
MSQIGEKEELGDKVSYLEEQADGLVMVSERR